MRSQNQKGETELLNEDPSAQITDHVVPPIVLKTIDVSKSGFLKSTRRFVGAQVVTDIPGAGNFEIRSDFNVDPMRTILVHRAMCLVGNHVTHPLADLNLSTTWLNSTRVALQFYFLKLKNGPNANSERPGLLPETGLIRPFSNRPAPAIGQPWLDAGGAGILDAQSGGFPMRAFYEFRHPILIHGSPAGTPSDVANGFTVFYNRTFGAADVDNINLWLEIEDAPHGCLPH